MRFSGARGVGSRRGLCSTMIARTTTKLQSSAVVVVAAAATVWNSKFSLAPLCSARVSRERRCARERGSSTRADQNQPQSKREGRRKREEEHLPLQRSKSEEELSVFPRLDFFPPPSTSTLIFFHVFLLLLRLLHLLVLSLQPRARLLSLSLSLAVEDEGGCGGAARSKIKYVYRRVVVVVVLSSLSLFSLSLSKRLGKKKLSSLSSTLPGPARASPRAPSSWQGLPPACSCPRGGPWRARPLRRAPR